MQQTQETRFWSLGWEGPLEKEMAPHSSILAWESPRTEEPDKLQSMGLQTVGHNWAHTGETGRENSLHCSLNLIACTIFFGGCTFYEYEHKLSLRALEGVHASEGAQNLNVIVLLFSHSVVFDSVTPWTAAHQAPLSVGFPRQEYCSGLPFPSPGALPNSGIIPVSPALQVGSLPLSHRGSSLSVISLTVKWKGRC